MKRRAGSGQKWVKVLRWNCRPRDGDKPKHLRAALRRRVDNSNVNTSTFTTRKANFTMTENAVTRFCLKVVSSSGTELYRGCKDRFPTDIPTYLSGVVNRLHELNLEYESSVENGDIQQYLVAVSEGSEAPTSQQCRYVVSGSWSSFDKHEKGRRTAQQATVGATSY